MKLSILSPLESRTLERFKEGVSKKFGPRLIRLKLFGSKARGTPNIESDLDVLVLIKDLNWREKEWVIDQATDLMIDTMVYISPLALTPEEYQELLGKERRLAMDIEKEGLTL